MAKTIEVDNDTFNVLERLQNCANDVEKRYNDCHFWKRGKIYKEGFINGYQVAIKILSEYADKKENHG